MGMTTTYDALKRLSNDNLKAYNILKIFHEQAFGNIPASNLSQSLSDLEQHQKWIDIINSCTPDVRDNISFIIDQIKRIAASQ